MPKRKKISFDVSFFPLIFGVVVAIGIVYFAYSQTQSVLKGRLQQRIESMVSIASLQFQANEIEDIIKNEPFLAQEIQMVQSGSTTNFNIETIKNGVSAKSFLKNNSIIPVTEKMKSIRESSPNIRYIYIWRKTASESSLAFVTDSDTVYPVDWNKNGKIDEIELPPMPGEEYDISDLPSLQEAFTHNLVLDDFLVDKWGTFLSGFAPIKNERGETVAILGMDVEIGDFYKVVRATIVPFSIQAILLVALLIIQTLALIKIWRNRVEIVNELDRQKDELLSIVSHQLATPVTSIRWQLEMLLTGDIGEVTKEQKEHIETTHRVTANLVDLIGMILDVSRIQLGKMQVHKLELDVNEFFKELVAVIEPRAIEKKVKFIKNIQANIPMAMLDKRLTNMTLENLLSNAVKYTPTGGEVEFKVELKDNRLYCMVRDTGMGIPEKEQAQIFGKLFRASNARNQVDGNGFGLYVAKGAVEGQGGSIRFESKEGKGTTFYVELPLK